MSTISNAAQVMVDKLVADMQGQTPLSSEEQLLVAKALDTMKNNVTFENALVAVAEEHLNTATSSLLSAEGKINAAKDAIVADADNLALIPTMSSNIDARLNVMSTDMSNQLATVKPTVKAAVDSSANNHVVSYYNQDVLLRQYIANSYHNHKPNTVAAVDNYDTGEFYCYIDYGKTVTTSANRWNHLVRIKADGTVVNTIKYDPFITAGADIKFIPLDDDTMRLTNYTGSTLYVQQIQAFTWEFQKVIDYNRQYYDKVSKKVYVVNSGILNTLDSTNGFVVVPETIFVDQDAFDTWATNAGHIPLHNMGCSFTNSNHAVGSVSHNGNTSAPASTHNLQVYYGGRNTTTYTSFTGFDTKIGYSKCPWPKARSLNIAGTINSAANGATGNDLVNNWKGALAFVDMYGNTDRLMFEYFTMANGHHYSSQVSYFSTMVAYSHQHRALISDISGQDYYSGGNHTSWASLGLTYGR
ncbi:hypothetical protein [Pseudoalteromonas denitrificans]|uniref:Uncharacterized protein n=1 Tax=Pseudoalteromonas denitrificans DSM 6059 TaxID=1123010 RepID=A0A1I1Q3J4_9GAMM|nr:hypothetical protein [Pseudoalteromonas denitrificans]SFD16619.1 hypothetical protein SAMN02745724_03721 [Pseudoalteromonas denitrificans DSM 6059]